MYNVHCSVLTVFFFFFFCPQGESRTRKASTKQSIGEHSGHGGYVASRTLHGGNVTVLVFFLLCFFRCYASFFSRECKWWRNEHGKAGFPGQLFWDLIAMLVSYNFFFSLSPFPYLLLLIRDCL